MSGPSAVESLVSVHCGIVTSVDRVLTERGVPKMAIFWGTVADPGPTVGGSWRYHFGGAGFSEEQARLAALGEAVERYSATWVAPARIVRSAASFLPRAVHPDRLRLFTACQLAEPGFPYRAIDADTSLPWVEGWSLTRREAVWLPAERVFMAYDPCPDIPVCPQTTNGLACAPSREEATLGALLEVIERDAFMVTWMSRLTPPRLELEPLDALLPGLGARFAGVSASYCGLDLSDLLGVPVVAVTVTDPDAGVALAVGAAAGTDAARAAEKALREAFQCYQWARLHVGAPCPDPVASFTDHVLYWLDPGRSRNARFLHASGILRRLGDLPGVPGATPAERLDRLVEHLAALDVEVCAVDVTAPDVRQAGLSVVRVVCPELCGLDVHHGQRYLGHPRLAGLREPNPWPHPFP